MKVKIIDHSNLRGIAKACEISRGNPFSEEMFERIIKAGHLSILEHASITFRIEGVSRVLTHQLVRKRIASYTQESQRHCDIQGIIYPKIFDKDEDVKNKIKYEIERNRIFRNELEERGYKKEDIRYFAFQASTTSIDVTYNLHSFWNFLDFRFCTRAQEEIRHLARIMFIQASDVFPEVIKYWWPRCVKACGRYCPEPCENNVMREFRKLREGLFQK